MHSRTSPLVTKIKVSGQGKQFKPDILIIKREQTRVSLVLFLKFSSATSLNLFFFSYFQQFGVKYLDLTSM